MSARPRALHVSPIMPALSGNGLAMRQSMFLEALHNVAATDLLVLPVFGDGCADGQFAAGLGSPAMVVQLAGRSDTYFQLLMRVKDRGERLRAFRSYGKSSLAAAISLSVTSEIAGRIRSRGYDLVHIGRSYLSEVVGLDELDMAFRTVDLDEDEAYSFRQEAEALREADDRDGADWAESEANATATAIRRFLPAFRVHFVSSGIDALSLANCHPGLDPTIVPNGVELPLEPSPAGDASTILFVGSLGYWPNIQAIDWFIDSVWPEIRRQRPDGVRLMVVGRGPAGILARLSHVPDAIVLSDVDDIAEAYARAAVVICPLRAGMGMRIKMIEAAAHAKPIVATSVAVQGLDFRDEVHVRLTDDPADFARAVIDLMNNPAPAHAMALRARSLVGSRHQRRDIVAELSRHFASIINRHA